MRPPCPTSGHLRVAGFVWLTIILVILATGTLQMWLTVRRGTIYAHTARAQCGLHRVLAAMHCGEARSLGIVMRVL